MVYIALASAVSYAAQAQVLEYFAPAFSASAGPFATATGSSILSLSCPPSSLALVVEYIAPAPAVYAAPSPVMVYLALAQAVSYAAQAQVLEYFAPASSASAGPFATATGSSILSMSCPPSTRALVVEYIAPAPAVYAAPAPVMVYIALAQAVSYAAQAQVLEYFEPAFSASAGTLATVTGGFGSFFVEPTVFSCSRLPHLVHTCSLRNGCCCALAKLPFINL